MASMSNWADSYDTALKQLNEYKSNLQNLGEDTSEVDKRIADLNSQKQTAAITGQKTTYKGDNSDIGNKISQLQNERSLASQNNAATAATNEANQISETEKTAARNEGLNKAQSALLGSQDNSTNYARGYSTANQTMSNQNTMTQVDYLEKMGQSQALQQTASNIGNSAGLATTSAFMQGLSDEREKEAPSYDDKILQAVNDYLNLLKATAERRRK